MVKRTIFFSSCDPICLSLRHGILLYGPPGTGPGNLSGNRVPVQMHVVWAQEVLFGEGLCHGGVVKIGYQMSATERHEIGTNILLYIGIF